MDAIVTFYRFTPVTDAFRFAQWLERAAASLGVKGTAYVAREGINANLWGARAALAKLLADLTRRLGVRELDVTWSAPGGCEPFERLRVRAKETILSFPDSSVSPLALTGERVAPRDWNALIDDPEVSIVDVRNRYEIAIGCFDGALDPCTETFAEFPDFVARRLTGCEQQGIALYCTGGIRCEKASSHLLERGFRRVYQLDGGILRYLSEVSPLNSRWRGECFVFDQRVSLTPALAPGEGLDLSADHKAHRSVHSSPVGGQSFETGASIPPIT